ncbi:MAG: patatin-like phospholipase family protein [Gammaproteobacteria bacterium]|nr:patatin-like phospholipase family protein [Pseudomonadales bacterium]MCP5345394.1 patatin-like phospholipase family protein [Pseudomonadales bacterium]
MNALSLYAGPRAMQQIREQGLQAAQFNVLAGASGGPKWFVLYGLDRYLFGEFFATRQDALATIGSSAGAWRLACLATAQPVASLDRLAALYSTERYSEHPTAQEVTEKARALLREVLGPDGGSYLVQNRRVKTHIIADRCRGFLNRDSRVLLGIGLALAATSNLMSRRALRYYFERAVFNNHEHSCELTGMQDIRTLDIKLTEQNIHDALIASGSIPFVLEGVRDIVGAPRGLYLDGGITDYHFDVPFHSNDGLVLYPHFYPDVVPGWFDKHLVWRQVVRHYYDNVLLLVPSREFVAALPYGKIPDRQDFIKLDYQRRVQYWKTVLAESERLAEEFAELVDGGHAARRIQLFDPARNAH